MPTLPVSSFDDIMKWADNSDSTELSKCNRTMRELYERASGKRIYRIQVEQIDPDHNEITQFIIHIRNNLTWIKKPPYLSTLKHLYQKLEKIQPYSIELQTTATKAVEIIEYLGDEWFDNCASISINCLEERENDDVEATEKLKRKMADLLSRFEIVDNIAFTDDEIHTSRYDPIRGVCRLRLGEKWQNRALSVKKANLRITADDIEMFLKSSKISKRLHFWMPSSTRHEATSRSVYAFRQRHWNNISRETTFRGSTIRQTHQTNYYKMSLANSVLVAFSFFHLYGLLAGILMFIGCPIFQFLVTTIAIMSKQEYVFVPF